MYRLSGCGLDSTGSGQVTVAGPYEHADVTSGSTTGGGILDQLSDCYLLKANSYLWSYVFRADKIKRYDKRLTTG
jgi:hypothetical protein